MKKLTPNYKEGMWKGAPASSFSKAKQLRNHETEAGKMLWEKLKNNQIKGLKFRRQHPIHVYVAEFYCHALKLIIEIDYDTKTSENFQRTKYFQSIDLEIMRFTNEEVLNNIDLVIQKMTTWAEKIENSNYPNPKGS